MMQSHIISKGKKLTTILLPFLMNITYVLIKILYDHKFLVDNYLFNFITEIDPYFSLTSFINFQNLDKISTEAYNEMASYKKNSLYTLNFNIETKFYFIINTIFSLVISSIESEYLKLKKKFNEFLDSKGEKDPMFKECLCLIKGYEVYLKNNEYCKYMLKFTNINIALFFMMNNSKYTLDYLKLKKGHDSIIIEDFSNYINNTENKNMSILPFLLVQNIINNYIILRIIYPEVLIGDIFSVRQYAYFSIIYISNPNFIIVPHFRAELLELILYILTVQPAEQKIPGCNFILI